MDPGERKGWTEVITPEDLDIHLKDIGQAEANAKIILKMFSDSPLQKGSKIWVPGCGTCQMFDFFEPDDIGDLEYVFSDINSSFFELIESRMKNFPGVKYKALIDDLENSNIDDEFGGILAVLLLEHIEWKKGIDAFIRLKPINIYLIIQEQEDSKKFVTTDRELRPSIKEFSKIAHPKLVKRNELVAYLMNRKYKLGRTIEKKVPDNKMMIGLIFNKSF